MPNWYQILVVCLFSLAALAGFFYPKNNFWPVLRLFFASFKKQLLLTKFFDILLFVIVPLACGPAFVFSFQFFFSSDVLNGLLSFYSVLFSILLGSVTFVAGEMSSSTSTKNVSQETLLSLFVTIIFSFLCCVSLVVGLSLECNELASKIVTSLVLSFSAVSFFQLLSIFKKILAITISKPAK